MAELNGVKVGYTDNGNVYRKSDVGKSTGAKLAAAGAIAGGAYKLNKFAQECMKDSFARSMQPGKIAKVVEGAEKTALNISKSYLAKYFAGKASLKDVYGLVKEFVLNGKYQPSQWFKESYLEKFRTFVSKFNESKTAKVLKPIVQKLAPLIQKGMKTKAGRAGMVATAITIPIVAAKLVGSGIGAIYDNIVNKGAKKQADFNTKL